MSTHIGAKLGDIAETILLPGDPLRAKWLAEKYLKDYFCYNQVRGMLGYTGFYKGKRLSVQGVGMGIPSISIYLHELFADFNVTKVIRIGTCGAIQPDLQLCDIVLASAASTDSQINNFRFAGCNFAPVVNFKLLQKAYEIAGNMGIKPIVGGILTSDRFYHDDEPDHWQKWAKYQVLAVEMQTAELYTLAAYFNANALSILTVVDSLLTGEEINAEAREASLNDMAELALETAIS